MEKQSPLRVNRKLLLILKLANKHSVSDVEWNAIYNSKKGQINKNIKLLQN
jgi:hypothetical protein